MSLSVSTILLYAKTTIPSLTLTNVLTTSGLSPYSTDSLAYEYNNTNQMIFSDGLLVKKRSISVITTASAGYVKMYANTSNDLQIIDSAGNIGYAGLLISKIPKSNFSNFSLTGLQKYIDNVGFANNPNFNSVAVSYTGTIAANAYRGSIFDPINKRIYFVPYGQYQYSNWHYYDCTANTVVAYYCTTDGTNPGPNNPYYDAGINYGSAIYSSAQKRIYLIMSNSTITGTVQLQYIDCTTGFVQPYTIAQGAIQALAFSSAVYGPKQDYIYFIPYTQAYSATQYYLNCATNALGTYNNAFASDFNTYTVRFSGGSYDPNTDRIYLASDKSVVSNVASIYGKWFYINCATQTLVSYSYLVSDSVIPTGGYRSAVYSPSQNRVYFIPYVLNATQQYINCTTNLVESYDTDYDTNIPLSYVSAVYSPIENRIYLVSSNTQYVAAITYIDCRTGNVKTKQKLAGAVIPYFDCINSIYDPTRNRIYYQNTNPGSTQWYLEDLDAANVVVSNILMSSALYGKNS